MARGIAAVSAGTGHHDTPFGGQGDLEASVGVDIGRTEIDSYDTRAYENVSSEEDGDARTYTLRLLGDHTLGERADLRGAFTYADIRHDERLTGETESNYRQRLWSLGLESAWRVIDGSGGPLDNLRVSVGGVVDMADTPETGGKPALDRLQDWGGRVGLTAALLGGNTLLHAGASRRARFPALRELYSGALGRFEPNPGLTPERLVAAEVGMTTRIGGGEVQAVVFHHRLSDAVVRIRTPAGNFRRVNRDQIRSTGLELLASARLGPFALAADLTLQDVALIDPAADLAREPENQPAVLGSVDARIDLPFDLHASTQARYTGRQFCIDPDSGADRELDAGTRVQADVARTWGFRATGEGLLSRIETSIAVENAFDTAVFDQCGLPEAGRLVRVQVRVF
jgi:iron complex outermembrane receptor protein